MLKRGNFGQVYDKFRFAFRNVTFQILMLYYSFIGMIEKLLMVLVKSNARWRVLVAQSIGHTKR